MPDRHADTDADPRVSGRKVVVAMFTLGFVATGLLWFYWDLHLRPFMPLQKALADTYENSSPRVDGGQRRIHKATPRVLRVVMRVPFDPNSSDETVQSAIAERIRTTQQLATKYAELATYDLLEVHLYHEQKEQGLSQKTFQRQISASPHADAG
ncbi:MAG: hypothetical protein R3C59_19620 [Planctomycetaceae bacterium]